MNPWFTGDKLIAYLILYSIGSSDSLGILCALSATCSAQPEEPTEEAGSNRIIHRKLLCKYNPSHKGAEGVTHDTSQRQGHGQGSNKAPRVVSTANSDARCLLLRPAALKMCQPYFGGTERLAAAATQTRRSSD